MATPTRTSSEKLLIQETNARFWAQSGYKPGQKLDRANPQDLARMPLWSKIFSDVKAENKAGTLVLTFQRAEVQQGIQDAAVALRAAAAHAEAGATATTPEDVILNARAAAAAQQVAAQRTQEAARVQPASVTSQDLQSVADAANVANANAPSPAGADQVARAQANAKASANEDPQVRAVRLKIARLAKQKFGGSFQRLFAFYAKGGYGDKAAVKRLVEESGIASWPESILYAGEILKRIDRNRDGRISAAEFDAVINPIGARPIPMRPPGGPPMSLPHAPSREAGPLPPSGSPREAWPPSPPSGSPSGSPREAAATATAPGAAQEGPPPEDSKDEEASGPNYKKWALVGAAVTGVALLIGAAANKTVNVTKVYKVSRPKKAYA